MHGCFFFFVRLVGLHKVHYFNVTTMKQVSNFEPGIWQAAVSEGGTFSVRWLFLSITVHVVDQEWISWVD